MPAPPVRVSFSLTATAQPSAAAILPADDRLDQSATESSPNIMSLPAPPSSTSAPALTEEQLATGWPDDNGAFRWEWVLDEMVWTFEQQDPDADDKFFANGYDKDGHTTWQERKTRGFVLFGKYFQALWD